MDEGRLIAIIDAYGADDGAWPAEERAAALALMTRAGPAVTHALTEARALDAMIEASGQGPALGPLKARILRTARARHESLGARLARALGFRSANSNLAVLRPVGVLGASALLGIVVGLSVLESGSVAAAAPGIEPLALGLDLENGTPVEEVE